MVTVTVDRGEGVSAVYNHLKVTGVVRISPILTELVGWKFPYVVSLGRSRDGYTLVYPLSSNSLILQLYPSLVVWSDIRSETGTSFPGKTLSCNNDMVQSEFENPITVCCKDQKELLWNKQTGTEVVGIEPGDSSQYHKSIIYQIIFFVLIFSSQARSRDDIPPHTGARSVTERDLG